MGKSKGSNRNSGSTVEAKASTTDSSTASFPRHLWLHASSDAPSTSYKRPRSIESLHEDYDSIWVIRNFMEATECSAWIRWMESDQETWQYLKQKGTRYMAARECHRTHRQDAVTANTIFQRLTESCPDAATNQLYVPGCKLTGCNPNLRLYKYEKGMSFGQHIDESNTVADGHVTKMTVLIYLSSCGGGATRFLGGHLTAGPFFVTGTNAPAEIAFAPAPGAMLLHVHGDDCLVHEADPVTSGIKYVLRTDLVYTRVDYQQTS